MSPLYQVEKLLLVGIKRGKLVFYRLVSHLFYMILVTLFLYIFEFECTNPDWLCTDYDDRLNFQSNQIIMCIYGYCMSMCLLLMPILTLEMLNHYDALVNSYASLNRSMFDMIKLNDYQGIDEMRAFGFRFDSQQVLTILFETNLDEITHMGTLEQVIAAVDKELEKAKKDGVPLYWNSQKISIDAVAEKKNEWSSKLYYLTPANMKDLNTVG